MASLLATLLFDASPHPLEIHLRVMTEGFHIFLGLVGMLLLLACRLAHRRALLIAAAAPLAAACLTPSLGISLMAAAAAFVALQRTTASRQDPMRAFDRLLTWLDAEP